MTLGLGTPAPAAGGRLFKNRGLVAAWGMLCSVVTNNPVARLLGVGSPSSSRSAAEQSNRKTATFPLRKSEAPQPPMQFRSLTEKINYVKSAKHPALRPAEATAAQLINSRNPAPLLARAGIVVSAPRVEVVDDRQTTGVSV